VRLEREDRAAAAAAQVWPEGLCDWAFPTSCPVLITKLRRATDRAQARAETAGRRGGGRSNKRRSCGRRGGGATAAAPVLQQPKATATARAKPAVSAKERVRSQSNAVLRRQADECTVRAARFFGDIRAKLRPFVSHKRYQALSAGASHRSAAVEPLSVSRRMG
jgi:hypothetical protein